MLKEQNDELVTITEGLHYRNNIGENSKERSNEEDGRGYSWAYREK